MTDVDVTPDEVGLQEETLELINSELADRLVRQADSSAKIDTKATALTGYAIAAASFLATQHPQPVLAGCAYGAYAVAVGFSITGSSVGRHDDPPAPRPLFNRYAARSRTEVLAALGATRVRAFEANAGRYHRKARLWYAATAALTAGAVLMIIAIVVRGN
ncbi:MAG: hypothetical protein ACRDOI_28925 [Trebonia sp.]